MAVSIKKKTPHDRLLKVVSVLDDAIDWANSYLEEVDLSDEEKKDLYKKDHDFSKLVIQPDCVPSFFVFKHPIRIDISRQIRMAYTKTMGIGSGNNNLDTFTEIFHIAFIGVEEGLDGHLQEPQRRNHRLVDSYLQGIEDAGIFEELASCVIKELEKKATDQEDKKK